MVSDILQKLQKYKGKKIAIYGLGIETEKALEKIRQSFQIMGLLDSYRETGTLYDMPIISLEQAIHDSVELIIVVARPGSCRAIAKRIGNLCEKNHIDLIDVRGMNLCNKKKIAYDFNNIEEITVQQLWKIVEDNDVISFDLFDTLVMRQTLFPSDIFEMVDINLKEHEIYIEDFSQKRMFCEKELSKYKAPTLLEIYIYMKEIYKISELDPEKISELEWQIDYNLMVPRKEVCEIFIKIKELEKEVYIVSDSYYSRQQIKEVMKKCKITSYTDILISCEYKTAKTQELFKELKKKTGDRSVLHIGDDVIADIESAKKNDISSYRLYSGVDLLEMSGYMGLWEYTNELLDKIKIGMFVAKIFNSPFQFKDKEKRICVNSAYDIGYLFFAPIISDFVLWLREEVKNNKIQNLWFCARDGYLIKKLYDEWNINKPSVYFLTSRIAAIRAGIEKTEDIEYVENMKFSGSLKEQLQERFGITIEEEGTDTLLDYSQKILEQSVVDRKNYITYINYLNLKDGDIAFFDFVAKGTSQLYIGRLLENHLKGFYFLQLESQNMKKMGLDIVAYYTEDEREGSIIFDDYYILETVLTSPMPSIIKFDENGEACYTEETRSKEAIDCVLEIQRGIFEYFQMYIQQYTKMERYSCKKIDEIFL